MSHARGNNFSYAARLLQKEKEEERLRLMRRKADIDSRFKRNNNGERSNTIMLTPEVMLIKKGGSSPIQLDSPMPPPPRNRSMNFPMPTPTPTPTPRNLLMKAPSPAPAANRVSFGGGVGTIGSTMPSGSRNNGPHNGINGGGFIMPPPPNTSSKKESYRNGLLGKMNQIPRTRTASTTTAATVAAAPAERLELPQPSTSTSQQQQQRQLVLSEEANANVPGRKRASNTRTYTRRASTASICICKVYTDKNGKRIVMVAEGCPAKRQRRMTSSSASMSTTCVSEESSSIMSTTNISESTSTVLTNVMKSTMSMSTSTNVVSKSAMSTGHDGVSDSSTKSSEGSIPKYLNEILKIERKRIDVERIQLCNQRTVRQYMENVALMLGIPRYEDDNEEYEEVASIN